MSDYLRERERERQLAKIRGTAKRGPAKRSQKAETLTPKKLVAHLRDVGGTISASTLASSFGVTPQAATRMLRGMVSAGQLEEVTAAPGRKRVSRTAAYRLPSAQKGRSPSSKGSLRGAVSITMSRQEAAAAYAAQDLAWEALEQAARHAREELRAPALAAEYSHAAKVINGCMDKLRPYKKG